MIEKDKTIDNLKELELTLIQDNIKRKKRLLEDQQQAEQDAEDKRIKDKRAAQSITTANVDQAYQDELEAFQGAIIDLIGDLNDILMLSYKGRIGRNLIPSFNALYLKVGNYKRELGGKLINLKPEDRQHIYTMNKRLEANVKSILIPILTKDKNKQERLKNKL